MHAPASIHRVRPPVRLAVPLAGLIALGLMPPVGLGQELPAWASPDKVYRDAPPADLVDVLLDSLAEPRWAVRDCATRWLSLAGPSLYSRLVQRHQETLSQEAKNRIQRIARTIFIRQRLGPAAGFLGVRLGSLPVRIRNDMNPDEPGVGVRIFPMPQTAAAEAGLRRGDVVITIEGEVFGRELNDPGSAMREFGQRIRAHEPGETVELTILRPVDEEHGESMTINVTLMPRPIDTERIDPNTGRPNPVYEGAVRDFPAFWEERIRAASPTSYE